MSIVKTTKKHTIKVVTPFEDKCKYISESDAAMDERAKEAVRTAIEKAVFCKKPVAKYDLESKRAYIEYANGKIKYVE